MTNTDNKEFRELINALKRALKERGYTYKDLAKEMGLTESGVKKIFSNKDASFGRLTQITGMLGLKIYDLLVELEQPSFTEVYFKQEQQEAFTKDRILFSIYYKLVVERSSSESVQSQLRLNPQQFFRYLKKLDELKLLKLYPGNKLKIPAFKAIRSFGDGPFIRSIYKEWGQQMLTELAQPKLQSTGHFLVRSLKMKTSTYDEFLSRLIELETEFTRRGVREMKLSSNEDLKLMRWMSFTDQKSFIK